MNFGGYNLAPNDLFKILKNVEWIFKENLPLIW